MDKIIFGSQSFDLAYNGAGASEDVANFKVVKGNVAFSTIESAVKNGSEEIRVTREDGTPLAVYEGYTDLRFINVEYNVVIDYTTEERQVQKVDEYGNPMYDDQGNPIMITITVQVPVYGDIYNIRLVRPSLEERVETNEEQITEIQEVLVEIVG